MDRVHGFAPSLLKMELDRVLLWRGAHVSVRQLAEDFARYLYLTRLKEPMVLLHAIEGGVNLLTRAQGGFVYADVFDESGARYQGLRGGTRVQLDDPYASGLVVKADVAVR
jgi:hypothetical protein